jgi:hypothetical protein
VCGVSTTPTTRPRSRPTGGPTDEGEEICHIVTPEDPDTALCGKDVTGYPWNPPWPMCVVCVDLAQGGWEPPA